MPENLPLHVSFFLMNRRIDESKILPEYILKVEFQGLRSPKNRSLLGVNEDFEGKRNAEIRL